MVLFTSKSSDWTKRKKESLIHWTLPTRTDDPTAISANIFQGMTCIPPGIESSKNECTLGGYPAYSVAATNVAQVQLAANLARNLNLRLVIKNTGHDLAAKSAGMGALSIWTHHFKDIQFFESYEGDDYSGPAMKLGSGVQEFELYEAADRYNVTVVAGNGYVSTSLDEVCSFLLNYLLRLSVAWVVTS